jgi:hypothetical protein
MRMLFEECSLNRGPFPVKIAGVDQGSRSFLVLGGEGGEEIFAENRQTKKNFPNIFAGKFLQKKHFFFPKTHS